MKRSQMTMKRTGDRARAGLARATAGTRLGDTAVVTKLTGRRSRRRRTMMIVFGGAGLALAAAAAVPMTRLVLQRLDARSGSTPVSEGTIDELTGLPNRVEGEAMLAAALQRGQARGRRVAVLYIDIDDFTKVNETFGRSAGDHVLQVAAARMQAQLRAGDTVCRMGGDDFIVLMEPAGPDHMLSRIGERIIESVKQPISYEGETIMITASCGVAVAVNGDAEPQPLVAQANRAIDRARASGRQVVQF